jgi:threonine synthase
VSEYSLRCRVCEEVAVAEPVDSCRRCDGPTDVTYDWERLAVTQESVAAGARSLWRYEGLLPAGARVEYGAGWTPLVEAPRLAAALGIDLRLKLEGANPTGSFKDRVATIAASAALDHGVTTLCCSSTGNLGAAVAAAAAATGLEAIVLAPEGGESAAVASRHPGARVFGVTGTYDDCRRLELELGSLFPWGFVSGNLHPYASEGVKTISFEIAEQLGWQLPDAVVCPAASGTLAAKLAQGFAEAKRAGLASGGPPRLVAGQATGSSPIAQAFADDRRISRVRASTTVTSLAIGDPSYGDLAVGAARSTGGAIVAVDDAEIFELTDLLNDTTGVEADEAGGAALGALIAALRDGTVAEGAKVVLVISGARPEPAPDDQARVTPVAPDVPHVLRALGLGS